MPRFFGLRSIDPGMLQEFHLAHVEQEWLLRSGEPNPTSPVDELVSRLVYVEEVDPFQVVRAQKASRRYVSGA
mgnify:CR=1 FL=1